MTRVAIFIDGSNLYQRGKAVGQRVDVEKLAHELLDARDLVRIYYYTAPLPKEMYGEEAAGAQQRFLHRLEMTDYVEVKLGRIEPRPNDRWEEKGVDTRIATDMVYFAAQNLYDTAILISGDGDLAYTVQHVKNLGKHVEVAAFKKGMAHELRKYSDRYIELNSKTFPNCMTSTAAPKEKAAKPARRSATPLKAVESDSSAA